MRRAGWALAMVALAGCSNGDTERLGRIARTVAGKFDGLTAGAQQQLAIGWKAAPARPTGESSLERRVLARMEYDKELDGCKLEVETPSPGVVRLRGAATLAQRRRAADLAWSTVGVTRVVDETTDE